MLNPQIASLVQVDREQGLFTGGENLMEWQPPGGRGDICCNVSLRERKETIFRNLVLEVGMYYQANLRSRISSRCVGGISKILVYFAAGHKPVPICIITVFFFLSTILLLQSLHHDIFSTDRIFHPSVLMLLAL